MRRAIAGVGALALGVGLLAGTSALGDSGAVQQVRKDLARADLQPPPLWPRDIPTRVGCCGAHLLGTKGNHFAVLFFKNHGRLNQRLVEYSRSGPRALKRSIKAYRVQNHPLHWQRIHGRRVVLVKGDPVFFYGWHQQGFSYFVISRYVGGVKPSHLRRMVASARPLG